MFRTDEAFKLGCGAFMVHPSVERILHGQNPAEIPENFIEQIGKAVSTFRYIGFTEGQLRVIILIQG